MSEMNCQQARTFFDAYLDGELSGSLSTELAAHRVQCSACRRELALLEVAGHVIRADSDGPSLSDDFSNRLLACIEKPRTVSLFHYRKTVFWAGGALATAAMLALVFNLLISPPDRILGRMEQIDDDAAVGVIDSDTTDGENASAGQADEIVRRLQKSVSDSGRGVLELKDLTDKTIDQLLFELGLEPEEAGSDEAGLSVTRDNGSAAP